VARPAAIHVLAWCCSHGEPGGAVAQSRYVVLPPRDNRRLDGFCSGHPRGAREGSNHSDERSACLFPHPLPLKRRFCTSDTKLHSLIIKSVTS